ncbi:MAG: hypothetical protein KDK55_04165, partial [Chlamydiia bacterium]|nr:hypothetical protein [Chlamydiia bacterium]
MRFELKCALKYLVPKWRQLSVSIISLLSIAVISLVVWLVIVFLSVTEGIEKKWIDELIALNSPLRMVPTKTYYQSYYYQIDGEASASNFSCKSIGEKLSCPVSDPYDLSYDPELPLDFPKPDLNADGELKDPVKEAWTLASSFKGAIPKEYEVSFGNLRLSLLRKEGMKDDKQESVLSQLSYITSFEGDNKRLTKMFLPQRKGDYSNLLINLEMPLHGVSSTFQSRVTPFLRTIHVESVETAPGGWQLPETCYPEKGKFCSCALVHQGKIFKIFIAKERDGFDHLLHRLSPYTPLLGDLYFDQGKLSFLSISGGSFSKKEMIPSPVVYIDEGSEFNATFNEESIIGAHCLADLRFTISGMVQGVSIHGEVPYQGLTLGKVSPIDHLSSYWIFTKEDGTVGIPSNTPLGDGVLLPKSYRENGAMLGDSGTICYTSEGASSCQEMQLPIYVAGFYDPGLLPVGNRVVLTDPKVTAALRSDFTIADQMLGNG